MKIKVTLEGTSPLLMAKFTDSNLDQNKKINKNATPKELAESFAYRNDKGELCVPGLCIYACLLESGKFFKKGKKHVTTRLSSLLSGNVIVIDKECSLGIKDYEVDARSVVNPSTSGRLMAYRPIINEWKLSFTLFLNSLCEFSEKDIRMYFDEAGRRCGLLSYRPGHKGWFGQFAVVGWEILEK